MTVGIHNFVKFTVIKPNCQKHSRYVFASGKNTMYPLFLHEIIRKRDKIKPLYLIILNLKIFLF